jgi:uncharacterized membrane protein
VRLREATIVGASCEEVWRVVSDLDGYLEFMAGVTRWDAQGERRSGMGARRRMLIRVGSAEVGGLVEIVEWDEPSEIAWNSITGVDQRGRIRVRRLSSDATRVELRFQYGVAGAGFGGWLAERAAAPMLRQHLRRTLRRLKRRVEQGAASPGHSAPAAARG